MRTKICPYCVKENQLSNTTCQNCKVEIPKTEWLPNNTEEQATEKIKRIKNGIEENHTKYIHYQMQKQKIKLNPVEIQAISGYIETLKVKPKTDAEKLINYQQVSIALTGNKNQIAKIRIGKKYKSQVDELKSILYHWLEKHSKK